MIIALCSPVPQCGKDTVADYLVDNYGFVKVAFGDEVKRFLKELGWNGQKDDKTRREIIIPFAELCKKINPKIWVEKAYDNLLKQELVEKNIVISDFRFDVEHEFFIYPEFNNREKYIVGIERLEYKKEELDVSQKDYLLFEKNYIVKNNQSKEALFKNVDVIMSDILKWRGDKSYKAD